MIEDVLTRRVGRRSLEISNPHKVLFPDAGITKLDLVDHYQGVAEVMLPHVQGRLVSMHRFPEGIDEDGFYHKDVPDHFPGWIHTEQVEKEGGSLRQLVIDDTATLVYLADQACITPHVWLSRVDRVREPDRMIFDLDPPGDDWEATFDDVRAAARDVRAVLDDVGLATFVMTSGSRGLHVYAPLRRGPSFDDVRAFARDVARLLAERHPERLTVAQRKDKRGKRVFLDVLRNAYAQTSVAPYAVRPRPGAPVATPLAWDELDDPELGPRRYTVKNIQRRLGQRDDPWQGMGRHGRSLDDPRQALDALLEKAGEGGS